MDRRRVAQALPAEAMAPGALPAEATAAEGAEQIRSESTRREDAKAAAMEGRLSSGHRRRRKQALVEMETLLDKVNPGLKSRVSDVVDFPFVAPRHIARPLFGETVADWARLRPGDACCRADKPEMFVPCNLAARGLPLARTEVAAVVARPSRGHAAPCVNWGGVVAGRSKATMVKWVLGVVSICLVTAWAAACAAPRPTPTHGCCSSSVLSLCL